MDTRVGHLAPLHAELGRGEPGEAVLVEIDQQRVDTRQRVERIVSPYSSPRHQNVQPQVELAAPDEERVGDVVLEDLSVHRLTRVVLRNVGDSVYQLYPSSSL